MTKKQTTPQRARNASRAFQATRAQRAFVAAAAGLGVPRGIICEMLPGSRPGETVAMTRDMLRRQFASELSSGLKLAVALVEARVFQRALDLDDRSALAAQMAILNTRGGWKSAGDPAIPESSEPALAMNRLSREERDTLRKLIDKATVRSDESE